MLLRVLRHCCFYTATLAWTLLLSPTLLLLPLPKGVSFAVSRLWTRGILAYARWFLGITYRVHGLSHLPKKGAYFIACKHQSVWETLFFSTLLYNPAFFLKRELMWIPLVGWFLRRLEMIPVKRGNINQKRMAFFIQKAVQEGRPLILFPEGTRTLPGQRVTYHSGIAVLAKQYDTPVIPAGLNSGIVWPRRGLWKTPGVITVTFCKAMPKGLDRQAFMRQLQEEIEEVS